MTDWEARLRDGAGSHDDGTTSTRIRILQVPDCPLVDRLIGRLEECMDASGVRLPVEVSVGRHPSPTLVIDGIDVATGRPVAGYEQCRLDLPTRDKILAALAHLG